ncbi:MAG: hypothetical protein OEZ06_31720 [Myxococcales bacterium]|nr:hypothetical protein [Myxococcales bacterium]
MGCLKTVERGDAVAGGDAEAARASSLDAGADSGEVARPHAGAGPDAGPTPLPQTAAEPCASDASVEGCPGDPSTLEDAPDSSAAPTPDPVDAIDAGTAASAAADAAADATVGSDDPCDLVATVPGCGHSAPLECLLNTYDLEGRLEREVDDSGCDGVQDSCTAHRYGSSGEAYRLSDNSCDGSIDGCRIVERDENGYPSVGGTDTDCDGVADIGCWEYRHDAAGNLLYRFDDSDCDGDASIPHCSSALGKSDPLVLGKSDPVSDRNSSAEAVRGGG